MKPRIYLTVQYTMFLLVAFAVGGCVVQAETPRENVTVEGTRPVAKALTEIEATYLIPVTFEDIRYVHESEMKTDDQGRSIIKGGTVSFTKDPTIRRNAPEEMRKAEARRAVSEVLQSYNAARGNQMFAVVEAGDGLRVIPIQSTDTFGQLKKVFPLLDTSITIPPGSRSAYELIEAIAQGISVAKGQAIGAGIVPMPLFHQHKTTISADNEPAQSVLSRLFNEIPVGYASMPNKAGGVHLIKSTLSWQVWCGPDKDVECAINIHVVVPKGRATVGLEGEPSKVIRPEDEP